ncbi:MAG: hypothetical protein R2939_22305 [Kofleriaceae bacterium]
MRYLPVGSRSDNVGIVAFNVRRYIANKAGHEGFIEVENSGAGLARRQLALYNGATAVDLRPIELGPGQRLRQILQGAARRGRHPPARGAAARPRGARGRRRRLRPRRRGVRAAAGAAHAEDPHRGADHRLPGRRRRRRARVDSGNLFLQGALLVYDNVDAQMITPAEYEANPALAADYDVVIFDEYTPAEPPPPPTSLIYFHPTGPGSPLAIRGEVARPRVTEIDEDHPVMRWITLSDVYIDKSNSLSRRLRPRRRASWRCRCARPDRGRQATVGARSSRVFGFRRRGRAARARPTCRCGSRSDDPRQRDGPGLGRRRRPHHHLRHRRAPAHPARRAWSAPPRPRSSARAGPRPAPRQGADRRGGHLLHPGGGRLVVRAPGQAGAAGAVIAELDVAANLTNPTESDIAPSATLTLGGRELGAPEAFAVTHTQKLWIYVLLVVLGLLLLEWATYHRRITL